MTRNHVKCGHSAIAAAGSLQWGPFRLAITTLHTEHSTLLCAAVPHDGRDIVADPSGVSAIKAAGIGVLVSLQAAGKSLTAATPATDPASIPAFPIRAG
jgi:hypothetical protein